MTDSWTLSVPYHLDDHLPDFAPPVAADAEVRATLPEGGSWQRMAALYAVVADRVASEVGAGRRVVVQSGDCTTALGTIAGLQRAGLRPSVVWFDAHGDLQTPETTDSGYLGGMPLRQLVGASERTAPDALGLVPIPERDVVLVDARDLDPPERAFLADSPIRHVDVASVPDGTVPDGPLYLHLDLDVLDSTTQPGWLFPTPAGPSIDGVRRAALAVLATGRVAALGLGCTWAAGAEVAPAVRELVEELMDAV